MDQVNATELTLGIYNGQRIAVKCWGDERSPLKILALHGWLDNAATWDRLAPYLIQHLPARLVAMDFSGHGHSSHAPMSSYLMCVAVFFSNLTTLCSAERVVEVVAVADALHWKTFNLMGHSMGGAVATITAGTVPHRVQRLVLVEALGPWPGSLKGPEALEMAVKERPQLLRRQRRVYPSFDAALERYIEKHPPNTLLPQSAEVLVRRGTEEVLVSGEEERSEKGVCFRHDPQLVGKSVMQYTEEETRRFLGRIACPVLLLVRDPLEEWFAQFIEDRKQFVNNLKIVQVKGGHHLHLDRPENVYQHIVDLFGAASPNL